jgi:hypothetical protein
MLFDLPPDPPKLWIPPKPAIIRQVTPDLLVPRCEPLSRLRRRAAGGLPDPTIAFLQFAGSASDLTTYTFAAQNIGTPGGNRHIGVVADGAVGFVARTISTLTVDGVSLTFARRLQGTGNNGLIEIWFGAVSTANSTGDVVVTYSAGMTSCRIGLFECHNILSATATATDTELNDNNSLDASVEAGGIGISGAATGINSTFNWSGTGVTDHGDQQTDTVTLSAASASYVSAGTASFTPDTTPSGYRAVLATFR